MSFRIFLLVFFNLLLLRIFGYRLLDMISARRGVPVAVADVYDARTLEKWREYRVRSTRYDLLAFLADYLLMMVFMGTKAAEKVISMLPQSRALIVIAPVAMVVCVRLVAALTDYYRQMIIRKSYGLTKMSQVEFWKKKALGLLLAIVMTIGLSLLLYLGITMPGVVQPREAVRITPLPYLVIYTLILLHQYILTPIIRERRERPAPLEDGTLRNRLMTLAEKVGYTGDIQVGNCAARFTNTAYYTLYGNKIVIYDVAFKMLDEEILTAVVLQEMGHAVHRDLHKRIGCSIATAILSAFILWEVTLTMMSGIMPVFGANVSASHVIGTFAGIVCLYLLLGLRRWMNIRQVKAADHVAARYGYGEELIEGLKQMARLDFEDLNPHPLKEVLYDDYPSMDHRIQGIRAAESVY